MKAHSFLSRSRVDSITQGQGPNATETIPLPPGYGGAAIWLGCREVKLNNDVWVIHCKKARTEETQSFYALECSCHKPTSCFPSPSRRINRRSDNGKNFPVTSRGSMDILFHGHFWVKCCPCLGQQCESERRGSAQSPTESLFTE